MKSSSHQSSAMIQGLAVCLALFMLCSSAGAGEIKIAGRNFAVEGGKVVITAAHFKDRKLPAEYQSFLFRDTTTVGEFGLITQNITIRDATEELGQFELRKVVKLRVLHRHSSTSAILVAEVATTMAGNVSMTHHDRSLFWFDGFDFSNSLEGSYVDLYQQAIIASDLLEYEIPTGEVRSVIRILPAILPIADSKALASALPKGRHPAFIAATARKWTDRDEKQSTVGVPVNYADGRISIFVEAKNKTFDIELTRLSPADQEWVQRQIDRSNALGHASAVSRQ